MPLIQANDDGWPDERRQIMNAVFGVKQCGEETDEGSDNEEKIDERG